MTSSEGRWIEPAEQLGFPHASGPLGRSYELLRHHRSDIAYLANFAHRVEVATFHMCVAFEQGGVYDFDIQAELGRSSRRQIKLTWYTWLFNTTIDRFRVLRLALKHEWTPPAHVELLTYAAFANLCDVVPASDNLKILFLSRRQQAIERLLAQLDRTVEQIEDSLELAKIAEEAASGRAHDDDDHRLAGAQAEILAHAGETLGLRAAASRLGMSHQNLHKRIGTGSALGVMQGRELLVPSAQFIEEDGTTKIVSGLKDVLAAFRESGAGSWSALQFLVERDPLLAGVPLERLKAGDVEDVVHAARSFLGLDEG